MEEPETELTEEEDSASKIEKASKRYSKSPKGKQAQEKYRTSELGKKARKRYMDSDAGKAASLRYYLSGKGKETREKRKDLTDLLSKCKEFLEANPGKTIEDFYEELEDRGLPE